MSNTFSRRGIFATLGAPLLRGQNMFADAEAYERFMGRWSRLAAPLLADFAGIPETGRVLDVGSGTGAMAFAVAQARPRCTVVGIDPSKEYVAYANSKSPYKDRVSFQVGDAQALQFPDSAFQASVSLLVFNFIPDPDKALVEVRRVTQSGGGISAAVWDYGEGMRMLRVFWDAAARIDPRAEKLDEKHMPLCRVEELSQMWMRGGLKDVDEQPLEIIMRFESFKDFWDAFLLGQGPAGAYVRSLNPEQRQNLRAEIQHRLAYNGPFDLPARLWAVRGSVP